MIFRHVSKIAKTSISLIISICVSTWNNSDHTGQIFMKFDIWVFSNDLSRKCKFN